MTTVSKYILILILSTTICLILLISIFVLITIQYRQSSSQITMKLISKQTITTSKSASTTTFSPEELHRLSAFKKFLNLPVNHPNPNPAGSSGIMNQFMRSVYQQISDTSDVRRKNDNLYPIKQILLLVYQIILRIKMIIILNIIHLWNILPMLNSFYQLIIDQ